MNNTVFELVKVNVKVVRGLPRGDVPQDPLEVCDHANGQARGIARDTLHVNDGEGPLERCSSKRFVTRGQVCVLQIAQLQEQHYQRLESDAVASMRRHTPPEGV